MNNLVLWLEQLFANIPLPLLEVWGRFGYYAGFGLALAAFAGLTLRAGGKWGLGRERQRWDGRAILSIPLTLVLVIAAGYLGSFIVLVPGAQTFDSLKDLAVFLCIVLFGRPALIVVPFAYGLSDLIEGVPPGFLLAWLPGYFINPACFWVAYRCIGRHPEFREARTWVRYLAFVAIFLVLEPAMWGHICAGKFTADISYRQITPALFFTTGITWLLAPVAMLGALPLARRFGLFWAEIDGHVREYPLGRRKCVWESGLAPARAGGEMPRGFPIRMFLLAPFVTLILLFVGLTAYVALRSASDDANKLATRLHREISDNIQLQLDRQLGPRDWSGTPADSAGLGRLLQELPLAAQGQAFIVDLSGVIIASSRRADDPVALDALANLRRLAGQLERVREDLVFRFDHVTARPLSRETWLAQASLYGHHLAGGQPDWIIATIMPESYYLAGVRVGNSRSAVIFAIALLLSLGVAAVLAAMVTAPLHRISEATFAFARGDFTQRVPAGQLEEFHALSDTFNAMAVQLKRNLDDLRNEVEMRKQAEWQVRRLNRTYAMLGDINQLIVRPHTVDELLEKACRIAVERGGFRFAWIGMVDPVSGNLDPVAHGGASVELVDLARRILRGPHFSRTFTAQALQRGQHAVCNDVARGPLPADVRDLVLQHGCQSLIALPLTVAERCVGTLNLYAGEPGVFDDEEVRLLDELAGDISFAWEFSLREAERLAAEARHARQREALIGLTVSQGGDGGLTGSLRRITESSARTLRVARTGVWHFEEDRQALVCQDRFERDADRHVAGERLSVDFPQYFRTLMAGELVTIDDADADPRTSEFRDRYLRPHGIGAMLDAPIVIAGKVVGVLCHEHVGPARIWTADEKMFVVAMANHVSLEIETRERRQAEAALRGSEERFRELAETIDDVFWISDPERERIQYVSPAYERIWGRNPQELRAAPRAWIASIHPDDRERVQLAATARQSEGPYDEEYRILRPDGALRWIRDRAFPVRDRQGRVTRIVGVARDITEHLGLQSQLRQSQKMEAIGQLAGGVAHDFNNMLVAILLQVDLLSLTGTQTEEDREGLRTIRDCAKRAADLTRQLLLFSSKQVMQPRTLDLNECITKLAGMLQRLIGEDVYLQLRLGPQLMLTWADAGMIDQVLMNLSVNARDAMAKGGHLTIETGVRIVGAHDLSPHPDARPGRYLRLSVRDTGCGIPREIFPRIFEPFFTTKPQGKGTGLGLATVFGIVRQHKGWIEFESEPGRGTVFHVHLRATADAACRTDLPIPSVKPLGGAETVLLVEDDPSVRAMATKALERYGYRVLAAADGTQGLEVWRARTAPVALLFTDLIMPGALSGMDVARRMRRDEPRLKVMFSSGYSADIAGKELELHEGERFLQKPYLVDELLTAVRDVLDV